MLHSYEFTLVIRGSLVNGGRGALSHHPAPLVILCMRSYVLPLTLSSPCLYGEELNSHLRESELSLQAPCEAGVL